MEIECNGHMVKLGSIDEVDSDRYTIQQWQRWNLYSRSMVGYMNTYFPFNFVEGMSLL